MVFDFRGMYFINNDVSPHARGACTYCADCRACSLTKAGAVALYSPRKVWSEVSLEALV